MLALLVWAGSLGAQVWRGEAHAAALRERLGAVHQQAFPGSQAPGDIAQELETRVLEMKELATHLGVTGSGLSVLDVLRLISAHIPEELEVSLSDLRLERHSVRARGYTPDLQTIDRVRAELEKIDGFEQIVLDDAVTDPRRGGKSFSLTIKFAGNGA